MEIQLRKLFKKSSELAIYICLTLAVAIWVIQHNVFFGDIGWIFSNSACRKQLQLLDSWLCCYENTILFVSLIGYGAKQLHADLV